ncbi:hypothetical protein [Microbacterium sp. AK031]|uniref:hypothetical protein n=1 Tax=Microbacterium sp. AK031 TaxID=2723076 RepID=UPI002167F0BA|nr:hypothetical protein [Microbacterium sp. AK031]MCS3843316.1 hypothetical protein [Microbacterium sp. AK031]
MSSMRTKASPSRLAAGAVMALAILPLSGCLFNSIPADTPAAEDPISTPEPTTGGDSGENDGAPATLSFEDGDLLSDSVYIEWGDGLMTDDGWETTSADDGNGGWAYGTIDGTCTAQFWQGYTSDVQVTPGDDSASSDAMLGAILQTDAATITPNAVDGAFSYQVGGNTDVANRQITGQDGDRTWIMSARAFATPGLGVYLIVDCTGGDTKAVLAEVIEKNALIAY